jgi:hypothetical protein
MVLKWRRVEANLNWLNLEAVRLKSGRSEDVVTFRVNETVPLSVLRTYRCGTPTTDRFVDNSCLASRPMRLGGQTSIISLFTRNE